MNIKNFIIFLFFYVFCIAYSQPETVEIQGEYTIILGNGISVDDGISICFDKAIANGIIDYLEIEDQYNESQKAELMQNLESEVQFFAMNTTIISQTVNGNRIYIKAKSSIFSFFIEQLQKEYKK
tara:strand:- start:805 stop:1179 length:375 start_codon:yes stop_codon:yes gene_type:complete